jgi:hypothetical protein
MKKISFFLLTTGIAVLLLSSCYTATRENYFDGAVLNCNMMMGFAHEGLQRELEQPTVKLVAGTRDQTAPMKRKEIIESKIHFLDEAFGKIKNLKKTDDTKDMLEASVALYDYVLPVYKTEYLQLAKLYDEGASRNQIRSFSKNISDKYFAGFEARFNKLAEAGKPYAARHNIKVNWDIKTSP